MKFCGLDTNWYVWKKEKISNNLFGALRATPYWQHLTELSVSELINYFIMWLNVGQYSN